MNICIVDENEIIFGELKHVRTGCPDNVYTLFIELMDGSKYERYIGTKDSDGKTLHELYEYICQGIRRNEKELKIFLPCETYCLGDKWCIRQTR